MPIVAMHTLAQFRVDWASFLCLYEKTNAEMVAHTISAQFFSYEHKRISPPKSSTENERSMVVIETPEGVEVMARQIAGAMARRIVTYAEAGEDCYIDEHMGFIKFGSRVDGSTLPDTTRSVGITVCFLR